jgi:hypothetical protein
MDRTGFDLVADCSRCAGLCCVALAFDRGEHFAFDKPAGVPCPNFNSQGRCSVHGRRRQLAFTGCIQYDCLGAGQRVTALWRERSWQDDPEVALRMFDAFRVVREVHACIELLRASTSLPLPSAKALERDDLLATLEGIEPTAGDLDAFERGAVPLRVRALLRSLAPWATPGKRALPVCAAPALRAKTAH